MGRHKSNKISNKAPSQAKLRTAVPVLYDYGSQILAQFHFTKLYIHKKLLRVKQNYELLYCATMNPQLQL